MLGCMSQLTLAELIATVQERNGWSMRYMQERAHRLGIGRMEKSNFSRLRGPELVSIKGQNIKDLARILDVPESMVARAALTSFGVVLDEPAGTVEDALTRDLTLSQRDKIAVRAVIDALRATP